MTKYDGVAHKMKDKPRWHTKPSAITNLVGGFMIFFCILMAIAGMFSLADIWNAVATVSWPSVPGKVTHVTEKVYRYSCGGPFRWDNPNCELLIRHNPEVEFEYSVGGVRYTSIQRFYLSGTISFSTYPRYNVGDTLSVRYDPINISHAVVSTEIAPVSYFIVFMGVISGLLVIRTIRSIKRGQ